MIRVILVSLVIIASAYVFAKAALGQTTTPSPSPTTTVPSSAPATGFGK